MLLYERTRCETLHKEIQLSYSCDPQTCLISYENDTTFGQGNQIGLQQGNLLPPSLDARWDFGQRQPDRPPTGKSAAFQVWGQDAILVKGNWISLQPTNLLPFKFETKMRFWSKATGSASNRHICCLWHIRASLDFQQRQPDRPPTGKSAAFGTFVQVWVFSKGNQIGLQLINLLPLAHSCKFGFSAKATRSASNW